jgi:hypothetical protein
MGKMKCLQSLTFFWHCRQYTIGAKTPGLQVYPEIRSPCNDSDEWTLTHQRRGQAEGEIQRQYQSKDRQS